MNQEKILDKIKKCLALSQSPEAHEAAAALRQAQKLMELHGISQADLGKSELGEADLRSAVSVSRVKDWELKLLNTVARAFGCRLMWARSNSYVKNVYGRYILLGLKSQVELAQYTAAVTQRKLMKARAQLAAKLPCYLDKAEKTRAADSFCHGWVSEVAKTIHDFALTKELVQLLDETLKDRVQGRKPAKTRSAGFDECSFEAGRQSAQGESLHRPLNERTHTLRIGA
jgi:hypothetical protein